MSRIVSHQTVAGVNGREAVDEAVLAQLREALRDLRFGTVSIIVQDGVVVQIDRTEKHRLRQPPK